MPHDADRRPAYADFVRMRETSVQHGRDAARQVLATTGASLPRPPSELDVLDVGCGYGDTVAALADRCRTVHGIEPTTELFEHAVREHSGLPNVTFERGGVEDLGGAPRFDLVVLDNVYEHLPQQPEALAAIDAVLRPEGVVYLLAPNRLWPVEAHYRLPFLAWFPLPWANRYLRLTGRGEDYTDASYARSAGTLARHLDDTGWEWAFTLPGDPVATRSGSPWHYRAGMRLLARFPRLWSVSKSLLVVARKPGSSGAA